MTKTPKPIDDGGPVDVSKELAAIMEEFRILRGFLTDAARECKPAMNTATAVMLAKCISDIGDRLDTNTDALLAELNKDSADATDEA